MKCKNRKPNGYWTEETVRQEALKYKTRSEFGRNSNGAYNVARKKKWIESYDWFEETRNPAGYWTEERVREEALKYKTVSEFYRGCGSAYDVAREKGWLKDYDWLERKSKPNGYWTEDNTREEAMKYKTKKEFREKLPHVYQIARENGWLDTYDWFEETRKPAGYWTEERVREEAMKYKTRKEFNKGCPGAYKVANKNGWLDTYDWFEEMSKPVGFWTEDRVREEAMKYKTKAEFRKGCGSAYVVAWRKGWLGTYDWFEEKQKPHGYWNVYENNREEAMKYKTRKEFSNGCSGAYNVACKKGWLDTYDWFEELLKPDGYWTEERVRKEAMKYKTRGEFSKNSAGAYAIALRNKWIDSYDWLGYQLHPLTYKLSLLTENDIQKNPADNRFFCVKGIDIVYWYMAGLVSKEYLQIAQTINGTRNRMNAMLTVAEDLQNRINNGEEDGEEEGEETIEVNALEALEQLHDLEADENDLILDDESGLPIYERQDILRNGDIRGLDSVEPTSENGRAIVYNTLQTWLQTVSKKPEFVEEIRNYHGSKFYDYIKELFFTVYDATTTMENPKGYSLPYELYPYQKILAYQLETRDSYSMWLDMGGGKTNCALYASRHNNLKNNVVIAPKSVLHESWVSQIYEAFPDSKIVTMFGTSVDEFKSKTNEKYNAWLESHLTVVRNMKEFKGFGGGYTYLLINYDKFSQDYAKKLANVIACNHIDYVVLDEVQNVKVRNRKTTSERHVQVGYLMTQIRKCNPNVKTSALTGTPLLNDIMEVKSIVEVTTGEKVIGIKNNRVWLPNVVNANKALVLNGFRYCPTIPIKHTTRKIEIECTPEVERKIRLLGYMGRKTYYSELESILTIAKINSQEVIDELKPGTIVYLLFPYKNNTANEVVSKIESLGFKVGTYFGCTVDKHQAYTDFVEGRTDILVASSPVCEGVNGLQERCDNMIILSLPQTYGKYDQLIKRIVRKRKSDSELQGKEVTIIIPQMFIELNENDDSDEDEWSWDRSRWLAIRYKKSLADAVVDGELQKVFTIDWNKLYRNAMKVFQNGIKDEEPVVKSKIVVEVPEKERKARERATCVVTETHRLANSSNHHTTHQRFIDNPQEFDNYHDNRELSKADWIEDPVERVASYINRQFRNKKIADLGCGTNKLSSLVKNGNTVTGFDHQQYKGNKDVVVADIADLRGVVKDHEFDCAVYCLSLWGKDYEDYFDEAHRILKDNRKMIIVEPISNFGDGKRYGSFPEFIQTVERHGFVRYGGVEEKHNFAYFVFVKGYTFS